MQRVGHIVLSGVVGMLTCGVLGFMLFALLNLVEPMSAGETVGYGLIVALVAAFLGFWIGAAVGAARLGLAGGALAGIGATMLLVALYVTLSAGPERWLYFLNESRIIVLVMAIPLAGAGIAAALFNRMRGRPAPAVLPAE
jgi:hypothetical protein